MDPNPGEPMTKYCDATLEFVLAGFSPTFANGQVVNMPSVVGCQRSDIVIDSDCAGCQLASRGW